MKFKIIFYGCRIGQLNTAIKERVERVVEADDAEAAHLSAYETHEHIHTVQITHLDQ